VSAFVADVPWTSGDVQPASLQVADERLRWAGLQAQNRAWLWLFHRDASWASLVLDQRVPAEIQPAEVLVQKLAPGAYRIQWWDTATGAVAREERQTAQPGGLRLTPPPFAHDLACKITSIPQP
jgi:hypothetical protein